MDDLMVALVVGVIGGSVTAVLAVRKGYTPASWFLFGFLFWMLALPWIILSKPNLQTMRRCPHCWDWINRGASACRHCGRDVQPERVDA